MSKRKLLFILLAVVFSHIILIGCEKNNPQGPGDPDNLTQLYGLYFGQAPPGDVPVRFAAAEFLANSSWAYHGPVCFSPDGNEFYFGKFFSGSNQVRIYYSKIIDDRWTIPSVLPSAQGQTNNPVFSSEGDTLFFISDSPAKGIYFIMRTASGWSAPIRVQIPMPASVMMGWEFGRANDGTFYVDGWEGTNLDIYRTERIDGTYAVPERIVEITTADHEFSTYADPDDEYIIYSSGTRGNHDLFISFHNPEGTWTDPVSLGESINSPDEDNHPYISPDGLYFFYITSKLGDSGSNPYWINAGFIEDLKALFMTESGSRKRMTNK